jgi:hypothetical protein
MIESRRFVQFSDLNCRVCSDQAHVALKRKTGEYLNDVLPIEYRVVMRNATESSIHDQVGGKSETS